MFDSILYDFLYILFLVTLFSYIIYNLKKMNNFEYLLKDLSKLKGVGKKTTEILKKKKLIPCLIYFGGYHSHTQTEVKKAK